MNPVTAFRGLAVEDKPMIAMVVQDSIEMLDYTVVGPVAQRREALTLPLQVNMIVPLSMSIFVGAIAMTSLSCYLRRLFIRVGNGLQGVVNSAAFGWREEADEAPFFKTARS